MLENNPKIRISATDCLKHPIFNDELRMKYESNFEREEVGNESPFKKLKSFHL